MKQVSILGIILTVGVLIFLKVFQGSIPRINDPITNILVFVGFVTFVTIYVVSKIRKE